MTSPFRYFKKSPDIIRLTVMLYLRYPLSLRQVEDLLHERGIEVSHETVRHWWNRLGASFTAAIRRNRRKPPADYSNWRWHMDEVFVKIGGEVRYLWRAVDHEGEVLDVIVTKRRNRKAALRLLKNVMKRYGRPREIVTDKLRSYKAALRTFGTTVLHETGCWQNNRAENSHQPFRRRERAMQRFRSDEALQKFASAHAQIYNHFNTQRHLIDRQTYRDLRSAKLAEWRTLPA